MQTKKEVSEFLRSKGGRTAYSGKRKIMFVKGLAKDVVISLLTVIATFNNNPVNKFKIEVQK
jgi:hypothetical protein